MPNPWEIYDLLIERAESAARDARVEQIVIGLTWTLCQCRAEQGLGTGLAMSPMQYTRTLPWAGTLAQRPISDIIGWIKSWNPFEAAIGLAAINSVLNFSSTTVTSGATALTTSNLAVFEYFLPRLKNRKVVVIGRYPGLERYQSALDMTVLERTSQEGDLPDTACEYLVPEADWVFLTASSLVNKTFPRLAELASDAVTVLMGPSVPWLKEWADFGIDFLAGVEVCDPDLLSATVAQGGGTRIFDQAVRYRVVDLGKQSMGCMKAAIADLAQKREQLKAEMDAWYVQRPDRSPLNPGRFPKWRLLEEIDRELSLLDLRFKRQWDARYPA